MISFLKKKKLYLAHGHTTQVESKQMLFVLTSYTNVTIFRDYKLKYFN